MNIICVSRFFKGAAFLVSAANEGHNVYLLTSSKLEKEDWPWTSIKDTFYMIEDEKGNWNMQHLIKGLAHKMQGIKFDFLVSLDDFDVENTAHLREYFRIDGMGETTARYFRDKLAMRMKAKSEGIPVPAFSALFHDSDINSFADNIPPPYMVKPRGQASATGIKKVHSKEELWNVIHGLGNKRDEFLVEKFAPGDVYHADSLTFNGEVVFTRVSKYMNTPFEIAHGGGIFRSKTIKVGSKEDKDIKKLNEKIMNCFGMQFSASHTEFIRSNADGKLYFLETSSRVGGANLAEMVEAASGVNLWAEWAKLEIASHLNKKYSPPKDKGMYGGIIVSLSRFETVDTSSFTDSEIAWRMNKKHHIGLIVASDKEDKIESLLNDYADRVKNEFHASLPAPDKPRD